MGRSQKVEVKMDLANQKSLARKYGKWKKVPVSVLIGVGGEVEVEVEGQVFADE